MNPLIISVAAVLVAVVLLAVTIGLHDKETKEILPQTGILMDAGSSKTEITVYKWTPKELSKKKTNKSQPLDDKDIVLAELPIQMNQPKSIKVDRGIASLDVEKVEGYLKGAMDQVEQKLSELSAEGKKVKDASAGIASHVNSSALSAKDKGNSGKSKNQSIPMYLEATAGMRLLEMRNHSAAENLYGRIKRYFSSMSRFAMKQVGTLEGTKEGLYSWLAVNYLSRTLMDKNSTHAVIECGGASSQISHEIDPIKAQSAIEEGKLNRSDYHQLTLFGKERNIRSTSYLCYGKDQFYLRVLQLLILRKLKKDSSISTQQPVKIDNPCANKGIPEHKSKKDFTSPCLVVSAAMKPPMDSFTDGTNFTFNGTSEPKKCYDMISDIINESSCKQTYKHCVANHQLLDASVDVYAISAFYFAVDAAFDGKFSESIKEEEYINKTDELCLRDSSKFNSTLKDYNHKKSQCFLCLLVKGLIKKMYHIKDWSRIRFAKKINGTSIGWSLGSMLFKSKYIEIQYERKRGLQGVGFYFLIFLSIVILTASTTALIRLLVKRKASPKDRFLS